MAAATDVLAGIDGEEPTSQTWGKATVLTGHTSGTVSQSVDGRGVDSREDGEYASDPEGTVNKYKDRFKDRQYYSA